MLFMRLSDHPRDFTELLGQQRVFTVIDWNHDQARGIFRVSDGRVLNIITRTHSEGSTWELWTMGGDLLERFNVDKAWRPLGITKDDEILVAYYDVENSEAMVAALAWQ